MAAEPVNAVTEATPHGGLPQMQSDTFPSQIFWLVVTFGLLFLILWRITLPMIEGIIGERRNRIEGDLGTAEKLRQQASESLAAYESELAGARGRAYQIMDANRKSISAELDSVKTRADEESQSSLKQAEERIAEERGRALGSLRPAAAEAAAEIVERLIGVRVSTEEAARTISKQQAPA